MILKKIFLILFFFVLINAKHIPQATLVLPQPNGQYSIGTANVELFDPERTQLRSSEKRRWMTTIFYPILKTKETAPYMPGTLIDGNVRGTKVFGHALPNSPFIRDVKFPLIISFPGRGGERQKETILYESLASYGYIVITMDQPYVANFVKFPDGVRISLTFKDLWNLPRNRDYRYSYDDEIIASAIKDTDFLLNNLHIFGSISKIFDKDKIILMGYSIGGNIAHIKGFADPRIRAIVDIDSKITERAIFGHIGVPPNLQAKPVLFIRGMLQYQEDVGEQLVNTPNNTIWSPRVMHSAFSDDAYFSAKISDYDMNFWESFYNWFFKKGPYFSKIDKDLGDYELEEWFKTYPEYISKWLKKNS